MKVLVTGGAGFIGSHLVDRLFKEGHEVIVLDNLSTGKKEFLEGHLGDPKFKFYKVNLAMDGLDRHFKGVDEVWHLAANADVKAALRDTRIDLEQNVIATYRVLEAMRRNNVGRILFTSSSTVYGEADRMPTPEDYAPLLPISVYGAAKLSCEALISSYCHTFGMTAVLFRLANIIGPRSTHGIIYDFLGKLKQNPNELEVLGDGKQKKSYLYVDDCVDAMVLADGKSKDTVGVFNVGSDDCIVISEIAELVCKKSKLRPKMTFTGGDRGWKGDVPLMLLDVSKLEGLGFKPKYNSRQAVETTIGRLME